MRKSILYTGILAATLMLAAVKSWSQSSGDFLKLNKGDSSISILTGEYDVETPVPRCPGNAQCEVTSRLVIRFPLKGCADKLGPAYVHMNDMRDGIMHFTVFATNIHNEKSNRADCVRMPAAVISYNLGLGMVTKKNVEVTFVREIQPELVYVK